MGIASVPDLPVLGLNVLKSLGCFRFKCLKSQLESNLKKQLDVRDGSGETQVKRKMLPEADHAVFAVLCSLYF